MPWLTKRIDSATGQEFLRGLTDDVAMIVVIQTSSGFPFASVRKADLAGDTTPSATVSVDSIVAGTNLLQAQGAYVAVRGQPNMALFSTIVGQSFDIALLVSDDDEVDPIA